MLKPGVQLRRHRHRCPPLLSKPCTLCALGFAHSGPDDTSIHGSAGEPVAQCSAVGTISIYAAGCQPLTQLPTASRGIAFAGLLPPRMLQVGRRQSSGFSGPLGLWPAKYASAAPSARTTRGAAALTPPTLSIPSSCRRRLRGCLPRAVQRVAPGTVESSAQHGLRPMRMGRLQLTMQRGRRRRCRCQWLICLGSAACAAPATAVAHAHNVRAMLSASPAPSGCAMERRSEAEGGISAIHLTQVSTWPAICINAPTLWAGSACSSVAGSALRLLAPPLHLILLLRVPS